MLYITKSKKRNTEVGKLLIIDASGSEIEGPIKTATASLVNKKAIQSLCSASLAEELYHLSLCSSHDVSDQLPEYYSNNSESSE